MNEILNFITNNQTLLTAVFLSLFYLANKLINKLAEKPETDVWDTIQPYSSALYKIVFDGVEYLGKSNPNIQKGVAYAEKLEEFENTYKQSKTKAVKDLFSWYEAAKGKKIQDIAAEKVGELLSRSLLPLK